MKIAFILFEKVTFLDFIGFYDAFTRLKTMGFDKKLTWDFCAMHSKVQDDRGLIVEVNKVKPELSAYDIVFIPGGFGTRALQHDEDFINWLQTAQDVSLKLSVCTGSLLFGAAGFLKNFQATTHPSAYKELSLYTEVKKERIVDSQNIISAGGVASSIDLGLYSIEKLYSKEIATAIAKQMDYPYFYRN